MREEKPRREQSAAGDEGAQARVNRGFSAFTRTSLGIGSGVLRSLGAGVSHVAPLVTGPVHATVDAVTAGGRVIGAATMATTDAALRITIRTVVEAALQELDLTEIVRSYVDINALAASLDLDAIAARINIAAIIDRVDIDAIIARVDLDAVVATVDLDAAVARVDLDAAVARVDLDAAVARVDIDAVVATVDLDAAVARVDIDAVIDRVDLNAVAGRLDPDPVVARANLDAVIARIDMLTLAREIIDGVDLPLIIRQSTGALSSDAVRGVRTQSRTADDAVAGFVGRLFGQGDRGQATSS